MQGNKGVNELMEKPLGNQRIRVMLVDDHEIVRRGLISVFQNDSALEVVGEASTSEEAVSIAAKLKPDVILLDLKMKGMSGAIICQKIMEVYPEARVLILTAFIDEESIFDCLTAGAKGYVLKDVDVNKLIGQIKSVYNGEEVLDPRVLGIVVNRFRDLSKKESRKLLLTPQEIVIIGYVSEGLTNKQIAQKMFLSDNTIKRHLQDIMNKLGVSNRAELVSKAMKERFI